MAAPAAQHPWMIEADTDFPTSHERYLHPCDMLRVPCLIHVKQLGQDTLTSSLLIE